MEEILRKIEQATGVTQAEMRSECRKAELVAARLLFALEANNKFPSRKIGKAINRNRTTIINMVKGRHKPSEFYFEYKEAYEKL